ncbi:helix-turn-helix domain-containing protein [Celeribacter sp.]|uniref:helix-turn-helix domain-containing protein n=1 Tax=Celeribacter sp. TaxID=1890673 RepID=UPI003A956BE9
MWTSELRTTDTPSETAPREPLSDTLKRLRQDQTLTLAKLAAQSGLSVSTLSRIENGQLSPTFETLEKLCSGLGLSLNAFFNAGQTSSLSGWRSLTRKGQGRLVETPHYRLELLCDDVVAKQALVFRAEILARDLSEFDALQRHMGQEQILVQSGQIRVFTEHYAPVDLQPGDSFAFDSAMGHALISLSETPAEVLWISTSGA